MYDGKKVIHHLTLLFQGTPPSFYSYGGDTSGPNIRLAVLPVPTAPVIFQSGDIVELQALMTCIPMKGSFTVKLILRSVMLLNSKFTTVRQDKPDFGHILTTGILGPKEATTARTLITITPTAVPKCLKHRNPYTNSFDARKSGFYKPYNRPLANTNIDRNSYTGTSQIATNDLHSYARIDGNNYDNSNAQVDGSGPGAEQEAGDMPMEG
ncbi:hypothetical protein BDN71DRAFT_1435165 [Pleurotus eryngii]|uniref:Uncharacterized protein n=1 Tax=Pleurotus eryngii TaxID=5323 RepID=A0A9P6DBQ5_PLEER|nr:hypothetical protein BDN71DRAFT_1435165 [Pleurotus eryngii]